MAPFNIQQVEGCRHQSIAAPACGNPAHGIDWPQLPVF